MFTLIFLSGIWLHSINIGNAQTCSDVDTQVCNVFNQNVDVCGIPCFSSLCPTMCNKCPLKCYHCDAVISPTNCTIVETCPSADYDCAVTEALGDGFSNVYKLGCAAKDVCSKVFSSGQALAVIGRRDHSRRAYFNGECCKTNLCNNHIPGSTIQDDGIVPSSAFVGPIISTGSSTVASRSLCTDIETTACKRLYTIRKDMCSDPCMLQACPRTCGKCAECYSCNHVANPENCTQTTVCEAAEKCYVLETLSSTGDHGYKVGCVHENVCARFHSQASNVFGRRSDPLELSVNGDCCNGDLCNHHALMHATGTGAPPINLGNCPYTSDSDHCPSHFHLIHGKCYRIGTKTLTRKDGQNWCRSQCSILAENLSVGDMRALHDFVDDLRLFVGAVDPDEDGDYVWEYSGKPTGFPVFDSDGGDKNCATISQDDGRPHNLELLGRRCYYHYKPLCQAPMK